MADLDAAYAHIRRAANSFAAVIAPVSHVKDTTISKSTVPDKANYEPKSLRSQGFFLTRGVTVADAVQIASRRVS